MGADVRACVRLTLEDKGADDNDYARTSFRALRPIFHGSLPKSSARALADTTTLALALALACGHPLHRSQCQMNLSVCSFVVGGRKGGGRWFSYAGASAQILYQSTGVHK